MPADPNRPVDVPLFAGLSRDELETGRRTATVTASSALEYFAMWGEKFRLLEREQPELARSLERAVTDRLARPTM